MMRRLALLLVAAIALTAFSPAPARAACPPIPGIKEVCEIVQGQDFLQTIISRVRIYVDSFLAELRFTANDKIAKAEAINTQLGSTRTVEAQVARDIIPTIHGPRCVALSAGQIAVLGPSVAIKPAIAPASATNPSADNGGSTNAKTAPPPPLGSLINSDKSTRSVSEMLRAQGNTSTVDPAARSAQYVARAEERDAAERDNLTQASSDQYLYAVSRYNDRMRNYGPSQSVTQFRDADVLATTILDNDVLPRTVNSPDLANYPLPKGDTSSTAPRTMEDAADAYCKNLIDPTVLGPNRGNALANDANRKAYAAERSGWNARLSLASSVCKESVGRRLAFDTPADAKGLPIFKIIQERRDKACADKQAAAGSGFLCDKDLKTTSEYQVNKTLYSEFFPSLVGAHMTGAANTADSLQILVQLDQLAAILNYRMFEMQEKLNLIKAAQLAQQVDSTRSGPNAAAPVQ